MNIIKKFDFSRSHVESVLLLIVCLNSTLMLPFSIYINYAILFILLFFKGKLMVSDNFMPFALILFVIVFSALREVASQEGTSDSLHYFVSSFFWQIGYVALILFKKPQTEDLAKVMLWSAFIQALLIILRLTGIFHFPIYGGLLDSNAGLVSIHQREQITAVSVSFSLWIWLLYGRITFGASIMCLLSLFTLLFTGSTGAFIAVAFMFLSRFHSTISLNYTSIIKLLTTLFVIAVFSFVVGLVSDNLTEVDLGEFDALESTQMISDLASGGEWLAYKLFEANSRTEILANYAKFSSDNLLCFIFGYDKNYWMTLNGELGSPHSFFLELFVHGGVIIGLYFVALFIFLFIYNFGIYRGMLFMFSFFVISIINSNNLSMPFLVVILALLYGPSAKMGGIFDRTSDK